MIRLILFFIVLILASFAAVWMADNDGVIAVQWLGWHIETTVSVVLVAATVLYLVLIGLVELFFLVLGLPRRLRQRSALAHHDKALIAIADGFSAVAVGDGERAERAANNVNRLLGDKPVALLMQAQAAGLQGNSAKSQKHYTALLEHKGTEFAALRGLLTVAQEKGDIHEAISLAEQAFALQPTSLEVGVGLLRLYKQTGRYADAQLFLEKQGKRLGKIGNGKTAVIDVSQEKAQVYTARARHLLFTQGSISGDNVLSDAVQQSIGWLESALKLTPDFVPALQTAVPLWLKLERKRKATAALEKAWKVQAHPVISALYMTLDSTADKPSGGKQDLKRAKKLYALQPDSVEGARVLAAAALQVDNITLARQRALQALSGAKTAAIYRLMADIASCEGEEAEVEDWDMRAQYAPSGAGWQCKECGSHYAQWDVVCGSCGAVSSIAWTEQAEATDGTEDGPLPLADKGGEEEDTKKSTNIGIES